MKDEFDSLDELFEDLKNNPGQIIVGETIEIDCPVCNKETNGKVIDEKTIQCTKCKEVMNLTIEVS